MTTTEAQKRATRKYITEKTDEIKVHTPKGEKPLIKEHAKAMNESLNGFVNRAIRETMERDRLGKKSLPASGETRAGTREEAIEARKAGRELPEGYVRDENGKLCCSLGYRAVVLAKREQGEGGGEAGTCPESGPPDPPAKRKGKIVKVRSAEPSRNEPVAARERPPR